MTGRRLGRSFGTALFLGCAAVLAPPSAGMVAAQTVLIAETRDGQVIGQLPFAPDQEICLTWAHSVTGGLVADCFENRSDRMVLTRSFLHDFAAGLGEVVGRGRLTPAPGGGYWIVGIDEPVPDNALQLRAGAMSVGHVLALSTAPGAPIIRPDPSDDGGAIPLSRIAAGQSLRLRLAPAGH